MRHRVRVSIVLFLVTAVVHLHASLLRPNITQTTLGLLLPQILATYRETKQCAAINQRHETTSVRNKHLRLIVELVIAKPCTELCDASCVLHAFIV
jgi:hypothetical protein